MKYKTTKKAVKEGYPHIVYTGYGNLQHLLSRKIPAAYTTRAEGWGADIYDFGYTAIVTGCAPFGTIRADYDLCRKYDEAAKNIINNYDIARDEQNEKLKKLIAEFIQEAKGR